LAGIAEKNLIRLSARLGLASQGAVTILAIAVGVF